MISGRIIAFARAIGASFVLPGQNLPAPPARTR